MTLRPVSALSRLTAALAWPTDPDPTHDEHYAHVRDADLAAVLAVVEAAQRYIDAREEWLTGGNDDNGFLVDEAHDDLRAALARVTEETQP